jgi:dihydrofolate synthase/folylpolyglutamate synthase
VGEPLSGDYEQALAYLFARTTGVWKFGLERTAALLEAMGDPQRAYPIFHVAGTNGKGSVVATLDRLLSERGPGVARYTSPHLVDFGERIVVDGAPIEPQAVVEWIERWTPLVERLRATFFEATTAMAFAHFAAAGARVAVVEVGLGGRLDATNVVTPLVAGVTSIGIDHTEYLGTSLEMIAAEKAGIFKQGRPAVIGEQDAAVANLLAERARLASATPIRVLASQQKLERVRVSAEGTRFCVVSESGEREFHTPLIGAHQAANTALALAMQREAGTAYNLSNEQVDAALEHVRLPGRFQIWGNFLFDVAHNAAGAQVLAATLGSLQLARPMPALIAILGDKDWRAIITTLSPHVDRFVFTVAPSAPAGRVWPLMAAEKFARSLGLQASAVPDFDRALATAQENAATTLVTGSFHTVGDAMARLQPSPLAG